MVYALLFVPADNEAEIQKEQATWSQLALSSTEKPRRVIHRSKPDPERPLKIGYVSPAFGDHVVGRNLLPLFAGHDRSAYHITCYHADPHEDALTARFRKTAHTWHRCFGVPDAGLVEMIRSDEIDVLVDLCQHMGGNRLTAFARKPAPIAVSFAGYPASTGLSTIRHRITDRYLEPVSKVTSSCEQLHRLDSFWCYDPCGLNLELGELPTIANGHFTFGCLNNFCKVNTATLKLWARVLNSYPRAHLLILSSEGSHRAHTTALFGKEGIDESRIRFETPRPRRDYMALFGEVDIVLDPFPYNGHTTSLDAL